MIQKCWILFLMTLTRKPVGVLDGYVLGCDQLVDAGHWGTVEVTTEDDRGIVALEHV